MKEVEQASCVVQIGESAGMVWKALADNGAMTMAQLVKNVGQPRDTVMQALGWLAREDKIQIEEDGRSRVISLR
jgi:predicted transcriptional regulator